MAVLWHGEYSLRVWKSKRAVGFFLSGAAAEVLARARVERSSCSSVGGGADLDGVGGIRTVDSQPVASGQSEASRAFGNVQKKEALVRYERFFLHIPRSLFHSQP